MNIKFEQDSVVIKLAEEELSALSNGEDISLSSRLPDLELGFSLQPQESKNVIELIKKEGIGSHHYQFLIPAAKIEELADIGKSRDGVAVSASDGTIIRLQVDIRKDSRHVQRAKVSL